MTTTSSITTTRTTTILNVKQQRFIKEYLSSGNATLSAQIAYGHKNKKVASAVGSRLLGNARIQETIKASLIKEDVDEALVIKALKKNLEDGAGVQAKASDANRAGEILLKYLGKLGDSKAEYNQYNFSASLQNLSASEILEKHHELQDWFDGIFN